MLTLNKLRRGQHANVGIIIGLAATRGGCVTASADDQAEQRKAAAAACQHANLDTLDIQPSVPTERRRQLQAFAE
jgi:hypothetical protein